jgi:hypothetical protein
VSRGYEWGISRSADDLEVSDDKRASQDLSSGHLEKCIGLFSLFEISFDSGVGESLNTSRLVGTGRSSEQIHENIRTAYKRRIASARNIPHSDRVMRQQ